MAELGPISEFDRVLEEIARKHLGVIPPPPPSAPSPAEPVVPGSGPSSIFAGPIVTAAGPTDREGEPEESEETWEDTTLTEAEATVVPNADEAAADAAPAVGASAVHPEVEVAANGEPLPPPGWYPDPHDALLRRWWNGQAWTDQVQAVLRNQTRFTPTQQSAQRSQQGQAVRDSLRGLADELGGGSRP